MKGHHNPGPGSEGLSSRPKTMSFESGVPILSRHLPLITRYAVLLSVAYSLSTPTVHNYVLTLITQLSFLLPVQLKHDIQSDTDITR